jgi:AcrR family transcriptional regulator
MILRDVGGGGSEGGDTPPMPHAEPINSADQQQSQHQLRRLPTTQRRAIRVERILDAAGQLVAERGYEPMTTSHIARRAKCSPGTFYQLFPDKRAVVRALSARNLDRYVTRLHEAIGERQIGGWEDAVDLAVDLFVEMSREDPGFRTVRFGDVVDVHLLDPDSDNDSFLATKLADLMRDGFGLVKETELHTAVVMAIKIADGLLRFAFARAANGDQAVIDHTKALLRAHFRLALGEPAGS